MTPLHGRTRVALAVVALLAIHLTLAVRSLVLENPTIDEVIHLPAGISYWQTGTYKLYHHNPPLVKLVAAWPVLRSGVNTDALYKSQYWSGDYPNKTGFAHDFATLNAADYFELFTRARLLMPLFSVIGGLVVFAWSARLYGAGGGLLSLALWVFCPNILAHTRLVTTDVGATSMGVLATFVFWLFLRHQSLARTALAGLCLGLAELTKFSLLLLYAIWPLLWLFREAASGAEGRWRRVGSAVVRGWFIVIVSVLVIDVGYRFEGVGTPLGDLPFMSAPLTRVRARPAFAQPRPKDVFDRIREYRENWFRRTILDSLPSPLPRHYLLGFDDQKLEADGIPVRFLVKPDVGDRMGPEGDRVSGYPVYLDGTLSQKSWWYYYLAALVYKVPEGTWALAILATIVLVVSPRSRAAWADESTLMIVPGVVFLVMSFGTNINLGLRYVLPVFPYVFIATGKLIPWAAGMVERRRRALASGLVGACLAATAASTAFIHPHYLAYFNLASGGPRHGSNHLIDSNLDWGQDLLNLKRWVDRNAPGERIGLAYFGQINPNIFNLRHSLGVPQGGLSWFLPPPRPGSMIGESLPPRYRPLTPETRLRPGLYAVSASLVRGLPWRVYDSSPRSAMDTELRPHWAAGAHAFSYFGSLEPITRIGYSIFMYRVTEEDSARLASVWESAANEPPE